MSGNGLTVVSLLDAQGAVVGYAAGTSVETAEFAEQVWGSGPVPTQTAVEYLKEFMIARVKELRVRAEENGALIDGNLWETSLDAQVKYLGSLSFAVRDPAYSGRWKTINNGYVTLDAAGVYGVCAGIMTYLQNCSVYEKDLLTAIDAASSVAQLQAIDFTSGIPVGSLGVLPPAGGTSTPPPLESGSVTAQDIETTTLTTTGDVIVGGTLSTAVFNPANINTGSITATGNLSVGGTFSPANITTPGVATVGSLNAGSGAIATTGTLGAGAATVTSLNAGSGTITTTGAVNGATSTITGNKTVGGTLGVTGAATVGSLNAGIGAISTTGTLGAGAATVTSLNAGSGTITTTGAVNGATSTITGNMTIGGTLGVTGTTTVTSLNAGSGAISTTGTLGAGAATVTSLNAGSGTITTTGAMTCTTSTITGNMTAGGTLGVTGLTTVSSGIQNNATNTNDSSGFGNAGTASTINWSTTNIGYPLTVWNGNTTFQSCGLLVKSAGNTTNPVLSVDYGAAQASAGTSLFKVLGNGDVLVPGRLGIGTTTPQSQLDLNNPIANTDTAFKLAGAGGAQATASLLFAPFNARAGGPSAIIRALDNFYSCDITFLNAPSGDVGNPVAVERMRINTDGNVGIGTNNPTSRLTVSGTMTVVGLATVSELNVLDQRLFRANIDGTLTSTSTTVRIAGTNLYRLGDRPPTSVVVLLSSNVNNDVAQVRVFEPIRKVYIGAQTAITLTPANSPTPLTIPITNTQFTANADSYYTIQIQFWRSSGLGTVTMQAAGFYL